jgi:hypothetical protein
MIERPDPVDEPELPEDPAPVRDPEPDPRAPKPKVTPLDEAKHIQDGIEVNET